MCKFQCFGKGYAHLCKIDHNVKNRWRNKVIQVRGNAERWGRQRENFRKIQIGFLIFTDATCVIIILGLCVSAAEGGGCGWSYAWQFSPPSGYTLS